MILEAANGGTPKNKNHVQSLPQLRSVERVSFRTYLK
jgi:hypothetical protein